LIVFLFTITVYSVWEYSLSLKERDDLKNSLDKTKSQVVRLENEKQNILADLEKEKELKQRLNQEISELKDYLKASKNRLTKLFKDHSYTQKTAGHLDSQLSLLRAENSALLDRNMSLFEENKNLKARLSSIVELRKAIKEIRRKMFKVSKEVKYKTLVEKFIEGNRGYLIKNGKYTTYPAKIKIEVTPLDTSPFPLKKQ
jgi:chromosome segregation ATPase